MYWVIKKTIIDFFKLDEKYGLEKWVEKTIINIVYG